MSSSSPKSKSKSPKGRGRAAGTRVPIAERLTRLNAGEELDVSGLAMGKSARKIKSPKGNKASSRRTRFGRDRIVSSDEASFIMAEEAIGRSGSAAGAFWREQRAAYMRMQEESKLLHKVESKNIRQSKRRAKNEYRPAQEALRLGGIRGYTPGSASVVRIRSPTAISPRTLTITQ